MMIESQLQYPGVWVYFFQAVTLEDTVHLLTYKNFNTYLKTVEYE